MSRRSPAPPGARVPLWASLATLPGRVWFTLALLWHRPRSDPAGIDTTRSIPLPLSAGRFDWWGMSPDIETVLFDLTCAHDPEPPSPAQVAAWCSRFPQHAQAIRVHVAAWVCSDLASNRVPLHYRSAPR